MSDWKLSFVNSLFGLCSFEVSKIKKANFIRNKKNIESTNGSI